MLAAIAGAIGGLATLPQIAAALFQAAPLSFVLLAIALVTLQRRGLMARAADRGRVRIGWAATAWLILAGALASPLLGVDGAPVRVALIAACAGIAALLVRLADRVIPSG